jgi:hypothetical protein
MDEQRKSQRHRTFKKGSILFNRAGGISCIVRNLSSRGAAVEVTSQIGIPDEFVLSIEADHFAKQCRVVWRHGNKIGLQFNES